ncbi:hypothetical protein NC652_015504 [Populus alba x Populus x berolinensis]|nr:hypothetical protein NC652_015504 [Populus alba x Populus x berolinensis]
MPAKANWKDDEKRNSAGCFDMVPGGCIHYHVCKCNSRCSSARIRASGLPSRLSLLLLCRKGAVHELRESVLQ